MYSAFTERAHKVKMYHLSNLKAYFTVFPDTMWTSRTNFILLAKQTTKMFVIRFITNIKLLFCPHRAKNMIFTPRILKLPFPNILDDARSPGTLGG